MMMNDKPTSSRSSRHSASFHGWVTLLLFGVIIVVCNVLAFKYYYHRDLSLSQFYNLSPKTTDLLQHLESPVKATILFSSKYQQQYQQQIQNLLEEYERVAGKNFSIEKVDPAYDIARASELQKRLQFDGTENLIIFEYKGHTRFVKQEDLYEVNPMTNQIGAFKGEQQFTAALLGLIEGKASKVYFTEGHGEHSIRDSDAPQGYGLVVATLKNENVETDSLNLAVKGEVPDDADAVVIAGPAVGFSQIEAEAIDHYLSRNGKLFILLDPYVSLGLDDLLQHYGLKFDNDLVLYRALTTTGQQVTISLALIYQGGFSSQPITAKFANSNLEMQLNGSRSITLVPDAKGQTNPKAQFLLQTDANSWGWMHKPNAPMPTDPHAITFDKTTDIPGPLTVAAQYDGGMVTDPKTQALVSAARIVIVGASKFIENDVVEPVGTNFFSNSVDWLVKKEAVLDISPKIPQQYGLSLSPMQSRTVGWISLFFIPAAALVLALGTWLSRRK
jgi:ABC-type uncharacterized transport system involved in gliding motility auxiliary subunit